MYRIAIGHACLLCGVLVISLQREVGATGASAATGASSAVVDSAQTDPTGPGLGVWVRRCPSGCGHSGSPQGLQTKAFPRGRRSVRVWHSRPAWEVVLSMS